MTTMPASIAEARDLLDTGRVSAEELARAALACMATWEPRIHAMTTTTVAMALDGAREADARLAAGETGGLLGIPVVVKDIIDVAGVPTRAGSKVLDDNVPEVDAPVWRRIRDGGAVLLGKANTHEFAYGGTSEPTLNPHDVSRMVGGSSGGPAAALAAGYCLGGLGTDTAGSIRNPAGLCGVAGLKTSKGLVDASGVVPLATTLDVVGPMARTVADLRFLLDGMTGMSSAAEPVSRQRVGVWECGGMSAAARTGFTRATRSASGLGWAMTRVEVPGAEDAVQTNFGIIGYEASRYHRRWAHRRSSYTPYVLARLDAGSEIDDLQYDGHLRQADEWRSRLDAMFETVDLLLLPGVPFVAPRAYDEVVDLDGTTEDRDTALCRNMALFNLTGHPALALPTGRVDGLPVGVQLVAPRGRDWDLIDAGARLQAALA